MPHTRRARRARGKRRAEVLARLARPPPAWPRAAARPGPPRRRRGRPRPSCRTARRGRGRRRRRRSRPSPGAAPLGRHVEERELLERDAERARGPGTGRPSQAAARPHDGVGLEPVGAEPDAPPRPGRASPARRAARPASRARRHQRAHTVRRAQHAALRLVQHEGEVVDRQAREQARAPPRARAARPARRRRAAPARRPPPSRPHAARTTTSPISSQHAVELAPQLERRRAERM